MLIMMLQMLNASVSLCNKRLLAIAVYVDYIPRYEHKRGCSSSFLDVAFNFGDFSIERLSLPVRTLCFYGDLLFYYVIKQNSIPLCSSPAFFFQ